MSAAALSRLVWKEFRILRSFWLALAALTVAGQVVVVASVRSVESVSTISTLFLLAVYGSALYSLVSGATLFATEHETGTYEFQRILPCSGGAS